MKSTIDDLKSLSTTIDRLNKDIKTISTTLTNSITKLSSELNLKIQVVKGLMELDNPSKYQVASNTIIIGNTETYSIKLPAVGLGEFVILNGSKDGSIHISPSTSYDGKSITGVYEFDKEGKLVIYTSENLPTSSPRVKFNAKVFTSTGLEIHNFVINVSWNFDTKSQRHGYPNWDSPIYKE